MTLIIDGAAPPSPRASADPVPGSIPSCGSASEQGCAPDADAMLLERLRRGEEAAYEELVRTEGRRLRAVARRLLRNEEDAQDAVQQALLSAFRALPAFNGESRLTTWLHRIVTNAALMKLRARGRKPEESIEDLLPRYVEILRDIEELSTEEAAGVLGVTTNTVKIRLHRARQALVKALDPVLRRRT
jgi:RNA polymerase sigma-70 factor, ECF subfamily